MEHSVRYGRSVLFADQMVHAVHHDNEGTSRRKILLPRFCRALILLDAETYSMYHVH